MINHPWRNTMASHRSHFGSDMTPEKIISEDVHNRWNRISQEEATIMKSADDLAGVLKERYGLHAAIAKMEAANWIGDRSF